MKIFVCVCIEMLLELLGGWLIGMVELGFDDEAAAAAALALTSATAGCYCNDIRNSLKMFKI